MLGPPPQYTCVCVCVCVCVSLCAHVCVCVCENTGDGVYMHTSAFFRHGNKPFSFMLTCAPNANDDVIAFSIGK